MQWRRYYLSFDLEVDPNCIEETREPSRRIGTALSTESSPPGFPRFFVVQEVGSLTLVTIDKELATKSAVTND